ncbi:MAG: FAD-dependent oxidoreductase [Planctomycetota bacterium]|nr:FAD-dependent oxidoreductase [Planctomycetota bacterium]
MAMVSAPKAVAENYADVVVYDSTPAGFCAAIAAAREGASVILLEPSQHIGGVNTGGLSFSDSFGSLRESLGGLWREWHERIAADYAARNKKLPYQVNDKNQVHWTYEPHVAMRVTRAMLDEAKVTVLTGRYLRSVDKNGTTITKLVTKNGHFTGKVFIDASYEGDLMAAAGVDWTIGREGSKEFGESHAGVHYGQKKPTAKISGFDDKGKPLPFITGTDLPPRGTADDGIQVFSFRLCLTRNPDNRVPMPQPENYDPADWEIARRFFADLGHNGVGFDTYPLPNGKFDGNDSIGRLMSLGMVGGGQKWCEADEAGRQAIWEAHKQYTLGLYHFLSTDPSLPKEIRKHYAELGFCKDEFTEYGHFSPELYVRQGRRMKGAFFMTQNDIDKNPSKDDAIAVSSFPADSHDVTRVALKDGGVVTEGAFLHWAPGDKNGFPFHIPYRAITPKKEECANLLVPVALSGTHVVICSVRVEPTWMTIGHSAGVAAAMAAQRGVTVQDLAYADLKPRLEKQGQRLALPWASP